MLVLLSADKLSPATSLFPSAARSIFLLLLVTTSDYACYCYDFILICFPSPPRALLLLSFIAKAPPPIVMHPLIKLLIYLFIVPV